jgi:UDP-GlcNAc3NAcA epimerase
MKLVEVVGARPQFVKAAAITRAIRAYPNEINQCIVHTGQHFDSNMSQSFFEQLDVPLPKYNLGIANLSHGAMTGRMIEGIEAVLLDERPDCVTVYGDTNSMIAGVLAAIKLNIPVAHIEAGVRSYNMRMPEEVNRVLADRVCELLLCPTGTAVENLHREGLTKGISLVGDVMYDAMLHYKKTAEREFSLASFGLDPQRYVLCTLHRPENADNMQRLQNIFTALNSIAESITVIMPLHPRTRATIEKCHDLRLAPGLTIIEPVSYLEMMLLESQSFAVITDSGGVQKEAFFHRVPCLTLRDETEWVETVALGWNTLCGADAARIMRGWMQLQSPAQRQDGTPYGDGCAASRIVRLLLERCA